MEHRTTYSCSRVSTNGLKCCVGVAFDRGPANLVDDVPQATVSIRGRTVRGQIQMLGMHPMETYS